MKAFNHSFAQTAYQPQQYSYGHQQTHQSEHTNEAEAAYESALAEDRESLEDLPGMGLSQQQQGSDHNDPNRRSAGVHDVMAERQRRLLEDDLNKKTASTQAVAADPPPGLVGRAICRSPCPAGARLPLARTQLGHT